MRWCLNPRVQPPLFPDLPAPLPPGSAYEAGFLSAAQERALLEFIQTLPLQEARYKEYTARRRVLSYGGAFDDDALELKPGGALPDELAGLRGRAAGWLGVAPQDLVHALVAEYRPGTPLGWHRDVPDFECVVGISLGSAARLRFRPYPPKAPQRKDIVTLELQPGSIYKLTGASRWAWQHSVPPVEALRWSITFRTSRGVLPHGTLARPSSLNTGTPPSPPVQRRP